MQPSDHLHRQVPVVSVILLNYNGLDDTRACIRSLIRDGCPDKEIIVWDNGSSQNEAELVAAEFGHAVRAVRSEKNWGYAGGNNRAANEARGEYLVFLNNDTEVTPQWLEPLLKAMQASPDIVACQPKLKSWSDRTMFDPAGGAGGFLDVLGFPYVRGRLLFTTEHDRGQYDSPCTVDWACGACLLTRTASFRRASGFDEALFAYMEEVDLCWRWRRQGYRIMSVPSSIVFHKGARIWRYQPCTILYMKHRNNLLILLKNASFLVLLFLLPLRITLDGAAVMYYLATTGFRAALAPLLALGGFLLRAPSFWQKRRDGLRPGTLQWPCLLFEYFIRGRRTYAALPKRQNIS